MTAEVEKAEATEKELTLAGLKSLHSLKQELGGLGIGVYGLRRIWWERGEAKTLYEKAKTLYEAFGRERGKKEIREAEGKAKEARRELQEIARKAAMDSTAGKVLEQERKKLVATQEELRAKVAKLDEEVRGGNWQNYSVKTPGPYKDKDGKQLAANVVSVPKPGGDEKKEQILQCMGRKEWGFFSYSGAYAIGKDCVYLRSPDDLLCIGAK